MTGWKNHHLKMFLHLLFKIRDFPPSHLSFRGGTYTFSMRTRGLGSQESHHLRCWSQACCIRNTRTSSGSWNFAKDEDKCLRRSWFLAKSAGICVSTQLLEGKSWKNKGLKTLLGLKLLFKEKYLEEAGFSRNFFIIIVDPTYFNLRPSFSRHECHTSSTAREQHRHAILSKQVHNIQRLKELDVILCDFLIICSNQKNPHFKKNTHLPKKNDARKYVHSFKKKSWWRRSHGNLRYPP